MMGNLDGEVFRLVLVQNVKLNMVFGEMTITVTTMMMTMTNVDTRSKDYRNGFLRPQIVFTMSDNECEWTWSLSSWSCSWSCSSSSCYDQYSCYSSQLVTTIIATISILIALTSTVTNIETRFLQNWLRLESSQIIVTGSWQYWLRHGYVSKNINISISPMFS